MWGVQVIAFSAAAFPLQVMIFVDLDRGQALPITQARQMCPSTTQMCKVCLTEAVHPSLALGTIQTAHQR